MHIRIGEIKIKAASAREELIQMGCDAYCEGLEVGIVWTGNYIPGGPHIYKCALHTSPKHYPRAKCNCKFSLDNWKLWMMGFRAGIMKNAILSPEELIREKVREENFWYLPYFEKFD